MDIEFTLRDITIRCQVWRPDAPKKMLALHGWLDNSASFSRLAQELTDYCIIAPDFAGQGLSDSRPLSATYHLWDDVLDILLLLEALEWQEFSLMGHSRGAMVAVMLAASSGLPITHLYLLDALMPWPVAAEQAPTQLARYLHDYSKTSTPHYFASREAALNVRAKASNFERALAEVFAQRQLVQNEHGWYWAVDTRLKAASAVKLDQAHNAAFLQALICPVTVFMANAGLGKLASVQALSEQYPQFAWHFLDGHHHMHMTDVAIEVAKQCQ